MAKKHIIGGVVHNVPADLGKDLGADSDLLALWESLTPLGRNEFICWIEDAKKAETRAKRIGIACENILAGKKRPCCWPGCGHRSIT